MPNYQNGKIYVLKRTKDDSVFYVGSTVSPLSKRVGEHKGATQKEKTKSYPVYKYINKKGGKDSFYIELYKRYPCNSVEELRKMEGRVILRLRGKGVELKNKRVAGRTDAEAKRLYKKTDKYKAYTKEYEKTDKVKARRKEFQKKYNKIRVKCECGIMYSKPNKSSHIKSERHKKIIALQQEAESE